MPLSGGDNGTASADASPEDKSKSLKDKVYGDFQPSQVPIAPDGGPVPGWGAMDAPLRPEPTEDNYICLRGPCRHFWHLVCSAGEGNPGGTWEALGIPEPREHHLTCTAHPGTETQLSFDELVFECSRWDPMDDTERLMLEARRTLYQIRRAKNEPVEAVPADHEGEEP
jgi:hypothetical protein